MKQRFLKAAAIILWLLIWQILAMIINKELLLPSPYITIKTLISKMSESSFYIALLYSLFRIIIGFLIAVVFAFILGVISGLSKNAEILLSPLITVIRSTPVMSFIILAIIWFSYNLAPLAVNIIMCFPPIYDNVVKGITNTDRKLLWQKSMT
jgi:NitT/TauT family transport system permease protein